MINDTPRQYDEVISKCRDLFEKKTKDYGTAWRILRLSTLTDQIYIKAKRIRSIQDKGQQLVGDSIQDEFIGILNYCVIAIMQLEINASTGFKVPIEVETDSILQMYDEAINEIKKLLFAKNHDYGEAWREMRVSSMTDLILMKLLRIKQIEDNDGKTLVSEGIKAGYQDIVNYAVFCLILLTQD